MADLDEIALALPETERSASDDARPAEPHDLVIEARLSRAQQRVAKAWVADHDPCP
jgi:hypothetical protein